jgi:hypothetical protein
MSIQCHGETPSVFKYGQPTWSEPREGTDFRTCSYCGCIHPDDLIRVVAEGKVMGGSDWKYGWPHKFYITAKDFHAKWYNVHLEDLEGEQFDKVVALLKEKTQIEFKRDEKGIKYHAPYDGYQA